MRLIRLLFAARRGRRGLSLVLLLGGTLLLAGLSSARWLWLSSPRPLESAEILPQLAVASLDSALGSGTEVTYARDIAPLVQKHCVVCHRPGDVGPFPLLTYEDVGRRARQIGDVTERRLMPPWKPVPEIRHFRDDLRLSEREIAMLRAWIAAGKPRGDLRDLPPLPHFEGGWRMGTPDLVLTVPEPFDVPAEGADIYRYFVLPTGLTEDRLVAAVDFQPGTPSVVHHAGFWFDRTGRARMLDARDPGPGYTNFGGPAVPGWIGLGNWTPGTTPQRLPEGTGRLVQQGSDLVLQVHYHPTGKRERDQSRVALYFAHPSARRLVGEIAIADMNLVIPAGDAHHRHFASYSLPVDTILLDIYPHMHMLGREIKATAFLPEGSTKTLVWIKDWSFGWQPRYVFDRPLRLPAGTRIELDCVFDNSAANPANPHSPPRTVSWGEGSDDEMGMCFFQVLTETSKDFESLTADNLEYYARTLREFWRNYEVRAPSEKGR